MLKYFILSIIGISLFLTSSLLASPSEVELPLKKVKQAKVEALNLFDPLLIKLQKEVYKAEDNEDKERKQNDYERLKFIQEELYRILSNKPCYLKESILKIEKIIGNLSTKENIGQQFKEFAQLIPSYASFNNPFLDKIIEVSRTIQEESLIEKYGSPTGHDYKDYGECTSCKKKWIRPTKEDGNTVIECLSCGHIEDLKQAKELFPQAPEQHIETLLQKKSDDINDPYNSIDERGIKQTTTELFPLSKELELTQNLIQELLEDNKTSDKLVSLRKLEALTKDMGEGLSASKDAIRDFKLGVPRRGLLAGQIIHMIFNTKNIELIKQNLQIVSPQHHAKFLSVLGLSEEEYHKQKSSKTILEVYKLRLKGKKSSQEGKISSISHLSSSHLSSSHLSSSHLSSLINYPAESFFVYPHKHSPKSSMPNLPKFHILPKPYSADISFHSEETEEDARVSKEIKLTPLPLLEQSYQIPRKELKSLRNRVGKLFPGWKKRVTEASNIIHHYEIRPQFTAFSARDSGDTEYYDYYDILLNLRINTPSEFKNYNFLPKGFIIEAQPVRYNNGWELVDHKICPVEVWEYCPRSLIGQTEATWTKGYTCLASASAGLTANLLTGGPSVSASGTASASYTSTFSFKRTIPDMDIVPMTEFNNVGWEITFNRLTSKPEQGQGFCSDRAINIGNFRWIWKVNRDLASYNLYSGVNSQNRDAFYFKINLFARFALVAPEEKAVTNFLHVFNNNNGDLGQIIGFKIPTGNNPSPDFLIHDAHLLLDPDTTFQDISKESETDATIEASREIIRKNKNHVSITLNETIIDNSPEEGSTQKLQLSHKGKERLPLNPLPQESEGKIETISSKYLSKDSSNVSSSSTGYYVSPLESKQSLEVEVKDSEQAGGHITSTLEFLKNNAGEKQRLNEINLHGYILTEKHIIQLMGAIKEYSQIVTLDLSNTGIADEHALTLSVYLLSPHLHLIYLNLSDNKITDEGAACLLDAFKRNPNLMEISLEGNPLTEDYFYRTRKASDERKDFKRKQLHDLILKKTPLKETLNTLSINKKTLEEMIKELKKLNMLRGEEDVLFVARNWLKVV